MAKKMSRAEVEAAFRSIVNARTGLPFNPGLYSDAPKSSSSGGGMFSALKKLGSGALDVLSVPQAAVFTGVQKAGHAIAPGKVQDLSWRNLGGSFYGNYKGGAGLLQGVGVSNGAAKRWGGLGLDVLADPLWLVAPVKAVKGGAEALKVGDAALGGVKELRFGAKLPEKTAESVKTSIKGGDNLMHEVTVKVKGVKSTGVKANKRGLRKGARKTTAPKSLKVTELQVKTDPEALTVIHSNGKLVGPEGLMRDTASTIKDQIETFAKASGSAGGNWKVRLGTKRVNVKVPTPFTFKPRALGEDQKVHAFKNSEEMKFGHRVRRMRSEMKGALVNQMQRVTEHFGASDRNLRVAAYLEATLPDYNRVRKNAAALLDEAGDGGARARKFMKFGVAEQAKAGRGEGKFLDQDLLRFPAPEKGKPVPWDATREATDDDVLRYTEAWLRADDDVSYSHRALTKESEKEIRDSVRALKDRGELPGDFDMNQAFKLGADSRVRVMSNFSQGLVNPNRERRLGTILDGVSKKTFMEQVGDPEFARRLTEGADDLFAKSDAVKHLGTGENRVAVRLVPELDPLVSVTRRLQKSVDQIAGQEVKGVIEAHGIGGQVREHLLSTVKHTDDPSSLSGTKLGRNLQKGIGTLKAGYTFVNPGHFFNNVWGDAVNANINGNFRHITSVFASLPKNKIWKLANGDPAMMKATFTVNGQKVLGEDLYALASITGLGTGQAKSEMLEVVGWLHNKRNPVGFMARTNHRREAAQRMSTWLKHMQAGDDPLVAAEKMRRVHFDYSELSPFEENWARNAVLFYTWIKKNGLLQMTGPLTRPAFYNLITSFNRAMPDMGDAPEYLREASWIPLPGLGGVTFADPRQDIRKLDLTGENIRQTLLAAVTPPVRIPFEIAGNKQMFTGAPVDQGYPKQHWLGRLVGGPEVQSRKDGPYAPGINPKVAYLVDQLTGPWGGLGGSLTRPDAEKSKVTELFGRWSGLKPFAPTPEAWARAKAAEESRNKRAESLRKSRMKED